MANVLTAAKPNGGTQPLFELRSIHGKGLGLFAKTSIARGTRIIEEAPLIVTPQNGGAPTKFNQFVEAWGCTTLDQRKAFLNLYRGRTIESTSEGLEKLARDDVNSSANQHVTDENLTAFHIFQTNSVGMGDDGNSPLGVGVFASYSRVNHSCTPNVHNSYNPTLNKLTVHATRQINENEEILTSYIDIFQTREKRNADLSEWDFRCRCKCCAAPNTADSDRRRERLSDAEKELAAFMNGQRSHSRLSIPGNSQEALEVAEVLLQVLREGGVTGIRVSGAYRLCSTFSLACGLSGKAVKYARKAHEVERYCLGEKTAHLENDLMSAKLWLQHVMSGHAKLQQEKQRADERSRKAELASGSTPKVKSSGKGKGE